MSEGGWTSKELADIGDKMAEGMIAGLESTDETVGKAIRRMQKSIVEEYEKQERKENMKIKDMQTLPEFFGVYQGDHIWIEGNLFVVEGNRLRSDFDYLSAKIDSKALVGCLTGQLKWSTTEPMTAEEEKILREIAAWHNNWETLGLTNNGTIYAISKVDKYYADIPFGNKGKGSKAYEVLAPILEKYGEIDLDDYRDTEAEKEEDEQPFGSCDFCGYEFNSELINEYEITHCPKCGEEIEESVDLDW